MTSRGNRKKDLPEDPDRARIKQILGHGVDNGFLEWYRQDRASSGFTTPFMKYQGPGNATNIGEPVNEADRFAQKHDLQYAHASYKFAKGRITEAEFKNRISAIDRHFISNNAANVTSSMNVAEQVASSIGTVGIGLKYLGESVVGQKYPSTDRTNTFTETPTTSTNLANKLMKNLKMNVSTSSMSGRETTPERGPPSKKQKVADTPSKGGDIPQAVLPTGEPPAPAPEMYTLTGTGREQASGGGSSDGQVVHYIEKPLSIFSKRQNVYTKSHKFMTFGLAPAFLTTDPAGEQNVFLTSYLAEIPWHIPALYLNQSEFDLLQNGAHVTELSVKVIYRGSTIQFETNASTTGLATLNQINDIAVAHGLNRSGQGSNVRYSSFNTTEPMIPTGILRPTYGPVTSLYRGMVRDYYGSNNPDTNFRNDVPKHQVGRQTFLYNYWANTVRNGIGGTFPEWFMFGGWPCLADKITQMDGKTVINQVVAESTYIPKMAPLKTPLRTQSHGLPFPPGNKGYAVEIGGQLAGTRTCTVQTSTATPSQTVPQQISAVESTNAPTNYNTSDDATKSIPNLDIYTVIEKSQMCRTGLWGEHKPHIQPSLHVGVQPVPALGTTATLVEDGQFNSWTDTRAYWEVIATMKTSEYNPTEWPYATQANIPVGDAILFNPSTHRPLVNMDARKDGATTAGLYTNELIKGLD